MQADRHNLRCALVGFLLAGFAGFAFSSEVPLDELVDNCPLMAVHATPQE